MRTRESLTLVVLCLALLAARGAKADGPAETSAKPTGDAEAMRRNTGVVEGLNLQSRPRVLWKYTSASGDFADVAAFDGAVMALDRSGAVHALDSTTGRLLWKSEEGYKFSFGYGLALTRNPEFDAVLVGGDVGLFALERKTGRKLWRTETPQGVAGPVCAEETVFAGGADGNVYAFELRTGRVKWKHEYVADRPPDPKGFDGERARFPGRPARPMNAATDGRAVFLSVFDQCRTLALDAETGERVWSFATNGWMHGRPSVGKQQVYVGSQDDCFYAIDKDMGVQSWKVKTKSRIEAAAAVADKLVVFGSCDGNIYAVDKDMGNVVWEFETEKGGRAGAPIYSQPLISHDTVYLAAMRGKVYALELSSGKRKWDLRPLAESEINCDPQVDAGRLFLTTRLRDGKGESAVLAIGAP